jgi:serpin B
MHRTAIISQFPNRLRLIYRVLILAFWVAICPLSRATVLADDAMPDADVKAVADSSNAFALDLYAKLAKTTSGNLLFSPYSIETALAMTYGGARGDTAVQMAKVLHFTLPDDHLHAAFAALSAKFEAPSKSWQGNLPPDLVLANGLWVQTSYSVNHDFVDLIRRDYSGELFTSDFASDPETARQSVNRWAAQKTHEIIRDVLPRGILNKYVRFVLVSAIYLSDPWEVPFREFQTAQLPFHLDDRNDVSLPLMCGSQSILGMEDQDIQMVELPLERNGFSVIVLLPRRLDALNSLDVKLTSDNLQHWMNQLKPREIRLYLPRLKITGEFELSHALDQLGMTDAFNDRLADYSRVAVGARLYLHHVVHKSFLRLDEQGVETSAVTDVTAEIAGQFGSLPPMMFRADHPFLMLIRDENTGAILFMGRVVNPRN